MAHAAPRADLATGAGRRRFAPAAERPTILRFHPGERFVHWAIAIPFSLCLVTAAVLVLVYNPDPTRSGRLLFSWIHRLSGAALAVLPPLAVFAGRRDIPLFAANVVEAWRWRTDEVRWLFLMGPATFNPRIALPEEGKFNAAEKLNFMMVTVAVPVLLVTGMMIWLPGVSIFAWFTHLGLALVATPLVLGHVFMATINPATRIGLSGMVSGDVDRAWAAHHYRRWYREHFGDEPAHGHDAPCSDLLPGEAPVLRCGSCLEEQAVPSMARLIDSVKEMGPTGDRCTRCGAEIATLSVVVDDALLADVIAHLDDDAAVVSR